MARGKNEMWAVTRGQLTLTGRWGALKLQVCAEPAGQDAVPAQLVSREAPVADDVP